MLEGGNESEDRVSINCLKLFHMGKEKEEVDLQLLPRCGWPTRVAEPVSPWLPTPAYSLPEDKFCL